MTRIVQSRPVQIVLGNLVAAHMAMVKRTTRWEVRHFASVQPIITGGQGFIGLCWHARFPIMNAAWQSDWPTPHILISRSRDGDIVDIAARALGARTIRGSSRKMGSDKVKGGRDAAASAVKVLGETGCVVITPDGPRGPRQRLQNGALRLARATGAPIVPCSFSVSRRRLLGSWDKTVLPGWFGRGVIIWGEPVAISRDVDDTALETLRAQIEAQMNEDQATADRALGHDPVSPA